MNTPILMLFSQLSRLLASWRYIFKHFRSLYTYYPTLEYHMDTWYPHLKYAP